MMVQSLERQQLAHPTVQCARSFGPPCDHDRENDEVLGDYAHENDLLNDRGNVLRDDHDNDRLNDRDNGLLVHQVHCDHGHENDEGSDDHGRENDLLDQTLDGHDHVNALLGAREGLVMIRRDFPFFTLNFGKYFCIIW
jgi:hypothetical protein